ncbi:MAG: response regulator transcription factor [Tissierellia bacterium]|nr:response regulator transcription factor [Tissierellia bacterium]
MINILIIEDDISLSNGIALTLKDVDREFHQCYDISSAKEILQEKSFDLLILDINLPDGSGIELCKDIRLTSDTPIIFLTANDTEIDMVSGLEAGGDDYISKPFSLAVLRARVNAILRRKANSEKSVYTIDDFTFDFEKMIFTKKGEYIELSKTEQKLLYILVNNIGRTVTRERLSESIWIDGTDYVDENALSVTVRRLRSKIEDNPSKPIYITTVFGIGYSWAVKR